jgi:hypothetical protein
LYPRERPLVPSQTRTEMRQLNEEDSASPVLERSQRTVVERSQRTIPISPALAASKTSALVVEIGNDDSEADLLQIAMNELLVLNGLTDQFTPNESPNVSEDEKSRNESLHEDMRHHEEAIEAIQRELALADLGCDRSITSKFRESKTNSDLSMGSKRRGDRGDSERSLGSKLRGTQGDSERSMVSNLNGSKRSMGSEISSRSRLRGSQHGSKRSMGSEISSRSRLRGSQHGSKRSVGSELHASLDDDSERSRISRLRGSQSGSDKSIGSRNMMQQSDEPPVGGAPIESIESCETQTRAHLVRELRFRELRHVPSQMFWSQPVTVKKPRTILRRMRLLCGKAVENPTVQVAVIWLIIINAIIMGIATFDFVTDSPKVDGIFEAIDKSFLIVFTLEIGMQLIYRGLSLFTDGWLVFDFVIVVMSWSLESLQVIRAFRIFRAFRLVTRLETLRELIMALGNVMPRIYAIAMLLILIFYIFAVLFTELFGDLELSKNYFGSLDASLFTCMELMTLEWAGIARETMALKAFAWAPFLGFISVTGFIVFNLIVAVVCDAVKVVKEQVTREQELELQNQTGGPPETVASKLQEAQERIWELTDHIEMMRIHHKELQDVVALLATELAVELNLTKKAPVDFASNVESVALIDSRADSPSSDSS